MLFTSSVIPDSVKLKTSYKLQQPLWKLAQYIKDPKANILLGDSRTDAMGSRYAEGRTGEQWANLAYGGATMPEIIETFWFVDKRIRLKNVYIGLSFNFFNAYKQMNRVKEAITILDQPLLYPFHRTIAKAFAYNVFYNFTGGDPMIGMPDVSPDDFWNFQLQRSAANYYENFRYGEDFVTRLREMQHHCNTYGIRLLFFIPPTHTDLQKRIDDFGLREIYKRWKNDLSKIVPLIDLDVPDSLTSDKNNFKDPYHLKNPEMASKLLFDKIDSLNALNNYKQMSIKHYNAIR